MKRILGLSVLAVLIAGAGLLGWRYRARQVMLALNLATADSAPFSVALVVDGREVAQSAAGASSLTIRP